MSLFHPHGRLARGIVTAIRRVFFACLTVFAVGVHAQIRWDLASAYPAANFHSENLSQFATEVEKATNGRLKITVHANASLFAAPEIKRAVQGGKVQAGEIILASFQSEWQVHGVDGLPFLANSYEEAAKLYQAQKPLLQRKFASQGMALLYCVPWPPQGLYSNKLLSNANDLKGVQWRAYSPATTRIAELLGARPVTVQAADLSRALAAGALEATMTSSATGIDSQVHVSLRYYYDLQAWLPKNAVLVNKKAFDELDKTSREAVFKAAADAEIRGWNNSKKVNTESMDKLRRSGVQVLPPSTQLKADMRKVGDTMLAEWLEKAGVEGSALITAFSAP